MSPTNQSDTMAEDRTMGVSIHELLMEIPLVAVGKEQCKNALVSPLIFTIV